MNIYEKMQKIKHEFLNKKIKKTGIIQIKNRTKYYYTLEDFIPSLIYLCNANKLFTGVTFSPNLAILRIINIEDPKEKIIYTSPLSNANLMPGITDVQKLGAVQTYQRRYLYITAFDIVEEDMLDQEVTSKNNTARNNQSKENNELKALHSKLNSMTKQIPKPPEEEKNMIMDSLNNPTIEKLNNAINFLNKKYPTVFGDCI